ncbi:MAG: ABC transporter ATP-binding protein [Oscillospiraceae bacterium]|nr:ABC transporter ATP-binding protein [Oscillospiraceae bacterium]
MGNALLEINALEKSFGETRVLNGISLTAEAGQFVTLLGASGCGKTTTLRIIAGLESPDSGTIFLDGTDVTRAEPNRRDVNTVFQSYALFPHMTVEQNVGYGLKLKRKTKNEIKKAVTDALALVQLDGFEKRLPSELSGGQSQRVAIARAVIGNPKLLLLDEPLGALDYQLRRAMQIELKRLQQQLGITFIYITHDQEEALNMSDVIAVMRGGRFEQLGTVSEIYDAPKTAYVAKFVGNANIVTANGATVAVRSEYVNIEPAGGETASGALVGTVSDKRFAGGQLRVSATLPDGTEITESRHGIDSPLRVGDRVVVSWDASRAVAVEGENE